jgi:hypothetical protein
MISTKSYEELDEFRHEVVDHAVEYVHSKVHTNGCENFWSLLKAGLHGASVTVEPCHLFRRLNGQAYGFDNRRMTDAEQALMFDRLTGKSGLKRAHCRNRKPLRGKRR